MVGRLAVYEILFRSLFLIGWTMTLLLYLSSTMTNKKPNIKTKMFAMMIELEMKRGLLKHKLTNEY